MKKTKLNIRFHNPNTEQETIQYITEIFVKVGVKKLRVEVENRAKNVECKMLENT